MVDGAPIHARAREVGLKTRCDGGEPKKIPDTEEGQTSGVKTGVQRKRKVHGRLGKRR